MSSQNSKKRTKLLVEGFGRRGMGRATEGCQAAVPAGDGQAEDSESSGQA